MIGTVDQDRPHIDQRISGEDAVVECLLDAFVDRGDVLTGDPAALDLIDELVSAARPGGLEVDDDVAVLTLATRLADVLAFDLLNRPA